MTKLIWGLLSSFLLIFVVWLAIAYSMYGNDFINYHLDLVATMNKMFNVPQPDTSTFTGMFASFRDGFSKVGDYAQEFMNFTSGNWGAFEWVKAIFTGITYMAKLFYYIYNIINFLINLVSIFVNYVKYACDVLINVIMTIFNPVFIGSGVVNE